MNRLPITLLLAAAACLSLSPAALAEDRPVGYGGLPAATDLVTTTIMNFTPSESGDRLVGKFDFGVEFSQISTFRLELMIPDGYQGTVVSTGNSSFGRSLDLFVHASTDTIEFTDVGPALPVNSVARNFYWIAPNEPGELRLGPIVGPNGEPSWHLRLGELLKSGQGLVTLTEVEHHSSHPLPGTVPTSHSFSYAALMVDVQARITVTGTTVPEPTFAATLAAAATCLTLRRPRQRTTA